MLERNISLGEKIMVGALIVTAGMIEGYFDYTLKHENVAERDVAEISCRDGRDLLCFNGVPVRNYYSPQP
jgi:hypothetical protein